MRIIADFPQWKAVLPLIVFLFGISGNVPAAATAIHAVTGQLNLLATIDGEPAFKPVIWQLRRLSELRTAEMIINRHSAVVDLEAGSYQVSATLDKTTKTQEVVIREGGKHKLVINLW